jgi:D-alanyl-D-alanine carboxypeptidase
MHIVRRTLLGWAASLPVLGTLTSAAQAATFDEALDAAFRVGPPALAGGVVTREGLVWSGVRGVRRVGSDQPVEIGDRWHLGSNTKAMTAAVFARLVEQGRTRWGLTLADAFPGVAIDPAWDGVTIEDLMRHRAGLSDDPVLGDAWFATARDDPRPLPAQRAALAAAGLGQAPRGRKGGYEYANLNYVIVGAAIERITGGAWEDAMQTQLFQPLGISRAGFGAPADPNAWGHVFHEDQTVPLDPAGPITDNPLGMGPAGGVHMTIADYARWLQAVCGRGDWLSADSLTHLNATAETDPPYALGWISEQASPSGAFPGAGAVLTHDGTNTFWYASALVIPSRGLGVFAFANDQHHGAAAARQLVTRLITLNA